MPPPPFNGMEALPSTLIAADSAASMEMMDNRYTYMRHPILLRFYSFVGLNYVKHGNKHPNRGGWIDFQYCGHSRVRLVESV